MADSRAQGRIAPGGSEPAWRAIGVDRLLRGPDGLRVDAAVEMPEWRASRFRATAVFFEGERFVVRSHRAGVGGRHVYELAARADDGVDPPGPVIEYDEEYVRLRMQRRSARRVADVLSMLAVPLKPVLGLLPARTKDALHGTVGLHPVEATRASITLEGVCVSVGSALAVVHIATAGVLTPELGHTLWLVPLLGVDGFVRHGALLREDLQPPGFLEWLVPGRRRRSRAECLTRKI